MNDFYKSDRIRHGALPAYQYWYRIANTNTGLIKLISKVLLRITSFLYHVEIPSETVIGKGLYIGHPYCITINPKSVIGNNCNIHKGVTIGQENRGGRKGAPTIGDYVWIGVNSTIVGAIKVGSDVLVAPNSYINTDVPDHSIVFGNPCIIKHKDNATEGYINHCFIES